MMTVQIVSNVCSRCGGQAGARDGSSPVRKAIGVSVAVGMWQVPHMTEKTVNQGRRSRRRRLAHADGSSTRSVDYHNLTNPFTPQSVFSDDEVAAIDANALRVLEELGLKILLPEARDLFQSAGALVDGDNQHVRIGRDIVANALRCAPKSFKLRGAGPQTDLVLELGRLSFTPGGGCPYVFDRERGRRPGALKDYDELMRLNAGFDVLQFQGGTVEPQDIPIQLRHLDATRVKLVVSNKAPVVHARGSGQSDDCFEMIRIMRGISRAQFEAAPFTYTVINTNSPRQLDAAMAQGIIDFARRGQISIITPFCLAGAMAPITLAGALTLQHAEAMAGITLAQLARPGAPVVYGSFCSSVDMRSGSPAFGTPEHVMGTLGSGQLARRLGLPWRASAGTGANTADAQAAHETHMSAWAAMMAGATIIIHSAGWLEGGLTFGYEKMILDIEMVQGLAELCHTAKVDAGELAFEALADVAPGGHFFATAHTMARYRTAFYEPLVSDRSNVGQWVEAGMPTVDQRATDIWKARLAAFEAPRIDESRLEELDDFVARRKAEGGAAPMGT